MIKQKLFLHLLKQKQKVLYQLSENFEERIYMLSIDIANAKNEILKRKLIIAQKTLNKIYKYSQDNYKKSCMCVYSDLEQPLYYNEVMNDCLYEISALNGTNKIVDEISEIFLLLFLYNQFLLRVDDIFYLKSCISDNNEILKIINKAVIVVNEAAFILKENNIKMASTKLNYVENMISEIEKNTGLSAIIRNQD